MLHCKERWGFLDSQIKIQNSSNFYENTTESYRHQPIMQRHKWTSPILPKTMEPVKDVANNLRIGPKAFRKYTRHDLKWIETKWATAKLGQMETSKAGLA